FGVLRRSRGKFWRWCRGDLRRVRRSVVCDAPNASMFVIGNIERAVRASRQTGWAVRSTSGLFHRSCEAVSEHNKVTRSLAASHGLEHHVVAALRGRRAVPGAVECDEGAIAIGRRELAVGDNKKVVRSPMRRKERNRRGSLRAQTDCLAAIAAVLGPEDQLLLEAVEVTLRPTIVGTALQLHDFLGRQLGAVLRFVEGGPVLRE